jgi:beta propeller repeat protein
MGMKKCHKVFGAGLLCVIILICLSAALAFAAAPVITGHEIKVAQSLLDEYDPAISGNIISYTRVEALDNDVWYYDISTGTNTQVITAAGDQEQADVFDNRIAYVDYRTIDIVLYDVLTGRTENLTNSALSPALSPAVGGHIIAWQDRRDGNTEIYARDFLTGEERRITNSSGPDEQPSISGDVIVYRSCGYLTGDMFQCYILAYNWATAETTPIALIITEHTNYIGMPDIDGSGVVYAVPGDGERDICHFDMVSGTEKCLRLEGVQINPNISGDFVSFEDLSTGISHIRLWHVPSDSVFTITAGTGEQFLNDIDGNRIVYTDFGSRSMDIYMYEFEVTFPPDDTTPPVIEIANCPATVNLNSSASVMVNVTDEGSGVKSQSAPNGENALDASTVGVKTFTVTAEDNSGNSSSNSCTYNVIYDFAGSGGFQYPINNPPVVNTAKAGSTIPVKWQIPDGNGGYVSDLGIVLSIMTQQVACSDFSSGLSDPVETVTAGESGLRYDFAKNQFIYNWKTQKAWAGKCFTLMLALNDGSIHKANFSLK